MAYGHLTPLSASQPLDYEISAFHTLLIKVENEDPLVPDVSYGPSSTATVHITVLDVNEGPVFYPDPMTVTKQENIAVSSVLLTVNATDPDSLQHQTIRWVSGMGGRHRFSFLVVEAGCQGQNTIELVKGLNGWEESTMRRSLWMMEPGIWALRVTAVSPHLSPAQEGSGFWAVFPHDSPVLPAPSPVLRGKERSHFFWPPASQNVTYIVISLAW